MDNKKLVYLFLAIGMTVVILAPIWPSVDAMQDIFLDFGLRTGLVIEFGGDYNVRNFELMEKVYNISRSIFLIASFAFSVLCIILMRSKKTWPLIALLITIAVQTTYLVATLFVSWELFKYPGSLATVVIIATAAKFAYDDLRFRSLPSVRQEQK